jgi:hypothetical protein
VDEVQALNGDNGGVLQVWALTECFFRNCISLCSPMGSPEVVSFFIFILFYAIWELDVSVISQNFTTKQMKAM